MSGLRLRQKLNDCEALYCCVLQDVHRAEVEKLSREIVAVKQERDKLNTQVSAAYVSLHVTSA